MSLAAIKTALEKELRVIQLKAFKAHSIKDIEKQKAKLLYQKIKLVENRQSTTEVDLQIANLSKEGLKEPSGEPPYLSKFVKESQFSNLSPHQEKIKLNNLQNLVTYLRSQREYTELLERYNPGLTMDQEDKVRRTANRVGLTVPE